MMRRRWWCKKFSVGIVWRKSVAHCLKQSLVMLVVLCLACVDKVLSIPSLMPLCLYASKPLALDAKKLFFGKRRVIVGVDWELHGLFETISIPKI